MWPENTGGLQLCRRANQLSRVPAFHDCSGAAHANVGSAGPSHGDSQAALEIQAAKIQAATVEKNADPCNRRGGAGGVDFASFHYGIWNSTKTIWKHWTALSGSKDQWSYADGKLTGHATTGQSMLASPGKYSDVTFSANVQLTGGEGAIAIRMQDEDNGYYIVIGGGGGAGGLANGLGARGGGVRGLAGGGGVRGGGAGGLAGVGGGRGAGFGGAGGSVSLERMKGGVAAVLDSSRALSAAQITTGQPIKVEVTADGPLIEVRVDGKKILQYKDWNFPTGSIGVGVAGNRNAASGVTFSGVAFH